MPGIIGSTGDDRSRAWIWLFSSTHSTTALSGGLWYRPTTSTTFSTNSGSDDSLNPSARCGLSPKSRQIRPIIRRQHQFSHRPSHLRHETSLYFFNEFQAQDTSGGLLESGKVQVTASLVWGRGRASAQVKGRRSGMTLRSQQTTARTCAPG